MAETSTKPLTWLITGCSSGFGRALTRIAQANGHKVIATSRNPSRTPELVDEVASRGGHWLKLDADDADCGKVIQELESRGTAIDVLVNSAGIGISGPAESFEEEEIRQLMETNFFGPYRLMRAVAPHMRERRSGMIVNISSGAGMEARHSLGAYGASKSALDGVTKTLHKEMADFNVRVLLVYLGAFDTAMPDNTVGISQPLHPDYRGTLTEKYMEALTPGVFVAPGDHMKAAKAIYEVVVGEGVGRGHEREMMLPLGVDMATRVTETRDKLHSMMEVFGEVCNNVSLDGDKKNIS